MRFATNVLWNRTNTTRAAGLLAALMLVHGCAMPEPADTGSNNDTGGAPTAGAPDPAKPANAAPTARVRLAQTFFPSGAEISITAAGSDDPDNDPLSFEWGMSAKRSVTGLLPRDQMPDIWADRPTAALPAFRAPVVRSPVEYTIRVAVRDREGNQDEQYTTLTVEAAGPVADAGPDLAVTEGEMVTLDASGSYHPFDEPLDGYKWEQVAQPGMPMVALSSTTSSKVNFRAPAPGARPLRMRFVCQVDGHTLDGPASDTDAVEVEIRPVGFVPRPVANAGADLNGVPGGTIVTLDGSASSAPSTGNLTYTWKQISPAVPRIALNLANSARPTFRAPRLAARTPFNFQLRVTDDISNKSHADNVIVTVEASATPDPDPDPDPNIPVDPNTPVDPNAPDPNDVVHDSIDLYIEVLEPHGNPDIGAAATVFDENFEEICHDFVNEFGYFVCADLTPGQIIIVEVVGTGWYHEQFVVVDDGGGEMYILVEF